MSPTRIHLIGIGGVGMAGLAVLLSHRGYAVDGCDLKRTPRTDWLESLGIPVSVGHDAAHLDGVDEVVVTPAVREDSAELVEARRRGIRVRRRGEVLAAFVSAADDSIAVCGSHGKTTTSTYVARILMALGERVEWAIGGETGRFPVAGGDGTLVVEADESDGTLADYRASTLVITNVDYDHPDHFHTVHDYRACFEAAAAKARRVVRGDDGECERSVAELAEGDVNLELAIRVALARGHKLADIALVVPEVCAELPDRRFQRLFDGVYTDYGHHPAEVAYSLRRARRICRGVLRVLFQPHRYSRTQRFLKEFAAALASADEVVLCPVYAAFERPLEGGTAADIYAAMRELADCRARIYLARSCAEAWEHAHNSMAAGDLTLVQGAGDILDEVLKAAEKPPLPRRILIGAGSNTWKSDLRLSVTYVKSDSPAGRSGSTLLGDPRFAFMAGIPGTIGGWVKMNAGAHGHAIGELIDAVKVDGEWIDGARCGFGYRTSAIVGEIQDVRWNDRVPEGLKTAAEYLALRRRFPSGTKGSVFKNPEGDFAGRLLESVGCRGLRVGGAHVWEEHANVIVAGPGATASDFLALAQLMQCRVWFRCGVLLEPEVRGLTGVEV